MYIIRDVRLGDVDRLLEIYGYYVINTAITFEYEVPSAEEFSGRIKNITSKYPYLVLEDDGEIKGYAYAGTFKARAAYDKSCELTIYLDNNSKKKGYGRALYEALEKRLADIGIQNLYACIGDPVIEDEYLSKNSEHFHAHLGFTKIGAFFKCGYKFGRWYNMIWMEKLIGNHNHRTQRIDIWKDDEYSYPLAFGFKPNMVSYIHDDGQMHPGMVVVPGGGYCVVSPTEAEIVAKKFYKLGYNAFVLTYTTDILFKEPLMDQPMKDLSRAIRLLRKDAERYNIMPDKIAICGFSAGAHLCGSLSTHFDDVADVDEELNKLSNRPDATVLCYPVITSGEFAHRDSFNALLGNDASKENLEYYSLEKNVNENTPPTFLWHTITDDIVPVENTYLFDEALSKAGVTHTVHIFSFGHHGLSLGDDDWANHRFGEPYTYEQVFRIVDAIKNDKVDVSKEKREELIRDFSEAKYYPDVTYPEIIKWPELADSFIKSVLE
ncbi:GNAT family N-acetyltransferase [Butyrivibrio sp. VCD2006]|uniref:GNAT family N-acetyltransferase n=1 Tax=Butyrivibrio sp. VCD2006 TaxID=1280664 RepID=UPI0003FF16B9|nr:GNAT family N-acetyltransferase [Butyrivibrio sp. VCD2006]